MDISDTHPLDALHDALATGDMTAVRGAVVSLDDKGLERLGALLGTAATQTLVQKVGRSRGSTRSASGGRVVVVHGIMGAQLDVVRADGGSERVWVNPWSIVKGDIADLALSDGTRSRDPGVQVRVAGLFPDYLPLLAELDTTWKVQPFAFDWRLDIDSSATRLAETVRRFAGGEPCHIVAHSMGGLVARRMIALYPEVWASMLDQEKLGRGGRLVQLGTPNRGSFAIPMVLTGKESVVRKLALIDLKHSLDELLPILATFPGSYQMLPAPGSGPDDRDRLYLKETWGQTSAEPAFLDRAKTWHGEMATVIDPGRIAYVAGYNQETPYRIRVLPSGDFEYEITRNGDGRVPHDLGLLDGVRTLWVEENHGDLPKNDKVLAGIHELLRTGDTGDLEHTLPKARGMTTSAPITASAVHPSEHTLEALSLQLNRSDAPELTEQDAALIESCLLRGFVGDEGSGDSASAPKPVVNVSTSDSAAELVLSVEVVRGDITKIEGDVYVVGHYAGVLPQAAEAALDRVISFSSEKEAQESRKESVLHSFTRRGVMHGDLGSVEFFPWADRSGRLVAVAGMGRPGSFGGAELRTLGHNITVALTALPNIKTVCCILIGSGTGNLEVREAVEALLSGAADALRREHAGGNLRTLKFVERDLTKAYQIHNALTQLAKNPSLTSVLTLEIAPDVKMHESGNTQPGYAYALSLAAIAAGTRARAGSKSRLAADAFLESLPIGKAQRDEVREQLGLLAGDGPTEEAVQRILSRYDIDVQDAARVAAEVKEIVPTRFSCQRESETLTVAALSDTAVVQQRTLQFDLSLFEELIVKATDPPSSQAPATGATIGGLLIPADFIALLRSSAAVVGEVDRYTARLAWEMMQLDASDAPESLPLAVRIPFARQLLTAYSPAPVPRPPLASTLRALVIGDPGSPKDRYDLPGARQEAIAVAELLRERGVEVEARIGAPSAERTGALRGFAPASRLDVLALLLSGRFDLVHYCGHGTYDKDHPERTGWIFEGGLLTAREIERVQLLPRLIVANACLSGRTSGTTGGNATWKSGDETGLLPSLADEFFRRGVRDYIGTAWEVSDEGAVLFATKLYASLLGDDAANIPPASIGSAVRSAREALFAKNDVYGALWAAYQHYGNPAAYVRKL
jgi:pimeloyl-ACP methyl ester carboxylesterase